jgi:glutamyl-Q tRNA(Asp) synthetase
VATCCLPNTMPHYVGRFAPSPTGPMHSGSLYTAVASYLDAKANQGKWLVRIEDIDPPREQADATRAILHSLQAHALVWDDEVLYQKQRHAAYQRIITELQQRGLCYYCECSRQQLQGFSDVYPGYCRHKNIKPATPCAIRLIANPPAEKFYDRLLGWQTPPAIADGLFNDFIIYRKDQLYAYQLAVVADDIFQGVTHVVRGSDILDSTFKQTYLYHYLHQAEPQYLHLPVIINSEGQKLSKQNQAPAVNDLTPAANLLQVLTLLGQTLPPEPDRQSPGNILAWATRHWDINKISKTLTISS